MTLRASTILVLIALVSAAAAEQPRDVLGLARGPYLQLGTPTSAIVRWRTNTASASLVRYGTSPAGLDQQVVKAGPTTEHVVVVTDLTPDTRYYYEIGDGVTALAGGDSDHFFVTPPTPGTDKPTRVWVIGDAGTKTAAQRWVRDAYYDFTGARGTDLWLMLGDNAYESGTDAEYTAAVFDVYPTVLRNTFVWPTLGNHDGYSANSSTQTGPYYDIFTLPTNAEAGGVASGTEAYYSFDYGSVHFICLDSNETDRAPSGAMLSWLAADLAANDSDWTIAFWHQPPYSKGSHDSDTELELVEMRQNALPILESYGVDLVLAGHSHDYERSFLLDGHYGVSNTLSPSMILDDGDGAPDGDGAYEKRTLGQAPHQGAVYVVAGSSGMITGGALNHPAMRVSLNQLGSLVLDVHGNRLDGTFVSATNGITDSFQLIKDPTGGLIFEDTFEAGAPMGWTAVVP